MSVRLEHTRPELSSRDRLHRQDFCLLRPLKNILQNECLRSQSNEILWSEASRVELLPCYCNIAFARQTDRQTAIFQYMHTESAARLCRVVCVLLNPMVWLEKSNRKGNVAFFIFFCNNQSDCFLSPSSPSRSCATITHLLYAVRLEFQMPSEFRSSHRLDRNYAFSVSLLSPAICAVLSSANSFVAWIYFKREQRKEEEKKQTVRLPTEGRKLPVVWGSVTSLYHSSFLHGNVRMFFRAYRFKTKSRLSMSNCDDFIDDFRSKLTRIRFYRPKNRSMEHYRFENLDQVIQLEHYAAEDDRFLFSKSELRLWTFLWLQTIISF